VSAGPVDYAPAALIHPTRRSALHGRGARCHPGVPAPDVGNFPQRWGKFPQTVGHFPTPTASRTAAARARRQTHAARRTTLRRGMAGRRKPLHITKVIVRRGTPSPSWFPPNVHFSMKSRVLDLSR
jgi:hypothetical protein